MDGLSVSAGGSERNGNGVAVQPIRTNLDPLLQPSGVRFPSSPVISRALRQVRIPRQAGAISFDRGAWAADG